MLRHSAYSRSPKKDLEFPACSVLHKFCAKEIKEMQYLLCLIVMTLELTNNML